MIYLSFLAFVIYMVFGIYALSADRHSRLNRIFSALCFDFALWSLGYILIYSSTDVEMAYNWYRFTEIGWVGFTSLFLHFALVFTERDALLKNPLVYLFLYLPPLGFLVWFWQYPPHHLMMTPHGWHEKSIDFVGLTLINVYYFLTMVLAIISVISWYRGIMEKKKKSIGLSILLASLIVGTVTFALAILTIIFNEVEIPRIFHLIILMWFIAIAYVIKRYKFLALDVHTAADEIVSAMSDLLILLDHDDHIIQVNRALELLTGKEEADLVGKRVATLFADQDYLSEKLSALRQDLPIGRFKVDIYNKDGIPVPINLSGSVIYDRLKTHIGTTLVGFELSDNIKLQEEIHFREEIELSLEHSEKQFVTMFDNSPIGIMLALSDGQVVRTNRVFKSLFGINIDTDIVKNFILNTVYETKSKEFEKKVPFDFEMDIDFQWLKNKKMLRTSRYDKITVRVIFSTITVKRDFIYYLCQFEDITAKKETEAVKNRTIMELDLISKTAMDFVEFPLESDLYQFIGEKLLSLVPNSYVLVTAFNPDTDVSTLKYMSHLGKIKDGLVNILGDNPIGKEFKLNDSDVKQIISASRMVAVPEGIYGLTFKSIPKMVCAMIEHLLGIREIYVIGMSRSNHLYGSVVILLKNGGQIDNSHILETFVHQATLALHRKILEEDKIAQIMEDRISNHIKNNILNSLSELISYYDIQKKLIWCNQSFADYFGKPNKELIGKGYCELWKYDCPDQKCPIEDSLTKGELTKHEILSDKTIWLIRGYPVSNGKSKPFGAVEIRVDISDIRKLESEHEKNENLYQMIFHNASDGLFMYQIENGMPKAFMEVNPAASRITGYSRNELLSMSIIDINAIHKIEEIPLIQETLSVDTVKTYEMEMFKKDGTPIITEVGSHYFHLDGKPTILSIIRDITDRKKALYQLSKSEEKFSKVFHNSLDAITINRLSDGLYIDVNDGFLKLTGYKREEVMGRTSTSLNIWKTPADREKLVTQLTENGMIHFEAEFRMKDGSIIIGEMTANLIEIKGEPCILSVTRDITEKKAYENKLKNKQKELEFFNKTLEARVEVEYIKNLEKEQLLVLQSRQALMGEMIANIAHQWKNPLNSMSILLQNLEYAYQSGKLDAEYLHEKVSRGDKLIDHMSQTIQDFRDFFKPNKVMTNFRLKKSVEQALNLLEDNLNTALINVIIEADESTEAYGYPNEFAQVIMNLINNARDALVANAVAMPEIRILIATVEDKSVLTLSDNAGGIPADIIERIFEPYFSTKKDGTGIGLYMSKMIIEKHMKGTLTAQNTDDGALFRIELRGE